MPAECLPPPGTPDGTVCVLVGHNDILDLGEVRMIARWHVRPWWRGGSYYEIPGLSDCIAPWRLRGWRFHSIAEPPADE